MPQTIQQRLIGRGRQPRNTRTPSAHDPVATTEGYQDDYFDPFRMQQPYMRDPQWWEYIFGGKYNKDLAQWQADMEYWMWMQENKWNLPKNQMERYQDAGLSPALMYGQGDAGNASKMNAPGAEQLDQVIKPMDGLKTIMDLVSQAAGVKKILADASFTESRTPGNKNQSSQVIRDEAKAEEEWQAGTISPIVPGTNRLRSDQEMETLLKHQTPYFQAEWHRLQREKEETKDKKHRANVNMQLDEMWQTMQVTRIISQFLPFLKIR